MPRWVCRPPYLASTATCHTHTHTHTHMKLRTHHIHADRLLQVHKCFGACRWCTDDTFPFRILTHNLGTIKVLLVECDVSKFEDCVQAQQKCAARWGDRRISFLFNNAVSVVAPTPSLSHTFGSSHHLHCVVQVVSVQMVNRECMYMCLCVESHMNSVEIAHFTTRKSVQLDTHTHTHTHTIGTRTSTCRDWKGRGGQCMSSSRNRAIAHVRSAV